MLYFGSCRYSHGGAYPWTPFVSRLYTTREIHQVIDMFDGDYTTWVNRFSQDDVCTIWLLCDMGHIGTGWGWEGSGLTLEPKSDPKDVKDIIIEVSSRKVYRVEYQNEPWWVSKHYFEAYTDNWTSDNIDHWKRSNLITLTEEEISEDLKRIKDLIKVKFHPEARLHVIPHLNLKTSKDGDYIPARAELANLLESACKKHDINFCNVGKHLEDTYRKPWLDICMPDSTHYAAGGGPAMNFINACIRRGCV